MTMPFRIPSGYRDLSVPNYDPDRPHGGDLEDYIDWLVKELQVAKAYRKAEEDERLKREAREEAQ